MMSFYYVTDNEIFLKIYFPKETKIAWLIKLNKDKPYRIFWKYSFL